MRSDDPVMNRALYNGVRGLAGSLVVFPIAERLERRRMRAAQRELTAAMAEPFAVRRKWAEQRLAETVRLAGARVPYYRDLFARLAFDPDKLTRDIGYLADLPYLDKDIIRTEAHRLLRDDVADEVRHAVRTGGSTGPTTQLFYDQAGADVASAVVRYARQRIGAGPLQLELHLATAHRGGIPARDWWREEIKCLANNRLNFEFASFSAAELDALWQRIRSVRPYLVHGHPSTLYQLALRVGGDAAGRRAFAVFEASGEVLDPRQRATIARVFGCDVVNRYGLTEAGVVAYQLARNDPALQVFDPVVWPEIADVSFAEELPAQTDARFGEFVITTLHNDTMPLLRYRTGDLAALAETADGFVLREVIGRIHDMVTIGGVAMPTHFIQDHIDRIDGVQEFQIEDRPPRPLFRLVLDAGASAETVAQGLRTLWGDAIDIEFVTIDALKRQGWRAKFRHLVAASPQA